VNKIVRLEFKDKPCSETVEELVPTIDYYRSEGKKMSDIYAALCEKKLLPVGRSSQMAFSTFKNVYYQHRKEPPSKHVVAKSNSAQNTAVLSRNSLPTVSASSGPTLEKANTDVDLVDESSDELSTQPQTFEERLAAHQKLAASEFFN
jgi:hypothetical protein